MLGILRSEKLAPQIRDRLDRANERRTSLKTEVDALALDATMGDHAAAERQKRLQSSLHKVVAEVETLEAAVADAEARDARAMANSEVKALREELAKYESFARARIVATEDLTKATEAASEAGRRFIAATNLLQDGIAGHPLPKGLILSKYTDVNIPAVEAETKRVVAHIGRLVRMTIASKLGQEIEQQ